MKELITYGIALMIGILILCFVSCGKAEASENYGITHAFMAGGATVGTAMVFPDATPYVAAGSCAWFIYRESQGPGTIFKSEGKSSTRDRIADWVVPCAVAAGFAYWEVKHGIFYPRVDNESVGVWYEGRF